MVHFCGLHVSSAWWVDACKAEFGRDAAAVPRSMQHSKGHNEPWSGGLHYRVLPKHQLKKNNQGALFKGADLRSRAENYRFRRSPSSPGNSNWEGAGSRRKLHVFAEDRRFSHRKPQEKAEIEVSHLLSIPLSLARNKSHLFEELLPHSRLSVLIWVVTDIHRPHNDSIDQY